MRLPAPLDYALLILLCLAWAAIYPLVKLAEHDFSPIALMALRASSAAICMLGVALLTRKSLRATRSQLGVLLALSVLNVSLIWVAISVAEQHLSSGLTALFTALIPIGTYGLSALVLRTEAIRPRPVLGLALAFAGLLLVLDPSRMASKSTGAALFMMLGCLGYAAGGILAARRLGPIHPVATATWTLACASITLIVLSLLLEHPLAQRPSLPSVLAVTAAGCLATALPNLIYYHLISEVGPQFASLFGYLVPVFGVLMGIVLMHEPITGGLLPGIVLIFSGVALVRQR